MKNLKKIGVYYFSILSPLVILMLLSRYADIGSTWFVTILFFYAIIYRPIIDGNRLYHKNIIKKENIWRLFVPFLRLKYFKQLYFDK